MSDLTRPMTAHARAVLARRGSLRAHTVPTPRAERDAAEPLPADERLLRREVLLHHLELERQRRRRRSA